MIITKLVLFNLSILLGLACVPSSSERQHTSQAANSSTNAGRTSSLVSASSGISGQLGPGEDILAAVTLPEGWIGSFVKRETPTEFMNEVAKQNMLNSLREANAHNNTIYKFVKCEERFPQPESFEVDDCGKLLNEETVDIDLYFTYFDWNTRSSCMYNSSADCATYQTVRVRRSFGLPHRSAIYVARMPASEFTYVHLRPHSNKNEVVSGTSYELMTSAGQLLGLKGEKRLMSLVHLSNEWQKIESTFQLNQARFTAFIVGISAYFLFPTAAGTVASGGALASVGAQTLTRIAIAKSIWNLALNATGVIGCLSGMFDLARLHKYLDPNSLTARSIAVATAIAQINFAMNIANGGVIFGAKIYSASLQVITAGRVLAAVAASEGTTIEKLSSATVAVWNNRVSQAFVPVSKALQSAGSGGSTFSPYAKATAASEQVVRDVLGANGLAMHLEPAVSSAQLASLEKTAQQTLGGDWILAKQIYFYDGLPPTGKMRVLNAVLARR